ncbi:serine/threonine-protein kinase EDR1-like, partial [Trifolium medium]|nr:serine/threonine-protein kinase EDR1-like [Trifolium medium]
VLADRINIPCMLVKGSYYTGTDDGAVNLIKADDGRNSLVYFVDMIVQTPEAEIPKTILFDIFRFVFLMLCKTLPVI